MLIIKESDTSPVMEQISANQCGTVHLERWDRADLAQKTLCPNGRCRSTPEG